MVVNFRLLNGLFFVLCVFAFSVSAQTIIDAAGSEKPESILSKHEENFVGDGSFVKANKTSAGENAAAENDEPAADYRLKRGEKEIQLEYGISPFNPSNFAGPKEFNVYGRHLHLFTVRFTRVVGTKRNVSYQYMFGATPLAIFTKNEVVNPDYISALATPNIAPTKRETTYGTGFQPINFKFIFLAKNRLKPYAQTGAGIMYVNKAVPVPRSTLFQFTGDFGGGLMYMLSNKRALNFGYKYFHISNGNINGKINNPGFNANVFYVNYSFFLNR